jgi:hypothetical protein
MLFMNIVNVYEYYIITVLNVLNLNPMYHILIFFKF